MTLAEVVSGRRASIAGLSAGHTLMGRLGALGLTVGAELEVLQNEGHGPLLVRVRNTRLALGRGEAMKILVEELPDESQRAGT